MARMEALNSESASPTTRSLSSVEALSTTITSNCGPSCSARLASNARNRAARLRVGTTIEMSLIGERLDNARRGTGEQDTRWMPSTHERTGGHLRVRAHLGAHRDDTVGHHEHVRAQDDRFSRQPLSFPVHVAAVALMLRVDQRDPFSQADPVLHHDARGRVDHAPIAHEAQLTHLDRAAACLQDAVVADLGARADSHGPAAQVKVRVRADPRAGADLQQRLFPRVGLDDHAGREADTVSEPDGEAAWLA